MEKCLLHAAIGLLLGANARELSSEKNMNRYALIISLVLAITAPLIAQQSEPAQSPPPTPAQTAPPPQTTPPPETAPPPPPAYIPKFRGDPARSDSEFAALAYMRVVIRAQRQFNKQYNHYAKTLAELVHSGSFTRRMVNPDRGDYTVSFKGKDDSYVLTMTPKLLDAQHRSFYAEDDGKIHADETKPADKDSPVVK